MKPIAMLLGLASLVAVMPADAALDFEGSVPAGWTVEGDGSISLSSDHYRLGSESLLWDWQAGDVLTAGGVTIDSSKVLEFYHHTCDLWLHASGETPGESLTIEFLDEGDEIQWRFEVQLNFVGWRHLFRSYKYDMERVGGGTDLTQVRFVAPPNGSGRLSLDALDWVRPRVTRRRDRAMPDVSGYYSDTLHHDLDQLVPSTSLEPASPAELSALVRIEAELWSEIAGSNPGSSAVDAAKSEFLGWGIARSGGLVTGRPVDRDSLDEIDDFLLILARAWYHGEDADARDMVIEMAHHLIHQGIAGGSAEAAARGSSAYGTRDLVRALLLLHDDYEPTLRVQIKDLLQWRLKRGLFWDPHLDTNKNTDFIHTESQGLMGLIMGFSESDQEKVEELRGLRHYFERFIAFSPGSSDGIKPDGTGFHHWNHYNNYLFAFGQLSNRLYLLRDSPFMVDQASYEIFRDACYVMAMMNHGNDFANSLSGRTPFANSFPISGGLIGKLAKAGAMFHGGVADAKLARFHNRVWGDDPNLTPFGAEDVPSGFWQFNYSPAGVYRTKNTVVTIRGLTDTFWGTEIYSTANRYGRYQAYGAIEVLYPAGRAGSGFSRDGWDWNHPPGATTICLPFAELEASSGRQDELSQSRFCGALSIGLDPEGEFGIKGREGVFGMDFQQAPISPTHNDTFRFRKSVFASNGMLLCLGSGIENDDVVNRTVTTLFQGLLENSETPTIHQGDPLVNLDQTWTWSNGARWLMDHLGTGYVVPDGQQLHLSRTVQSSPNQSGSGADVEGEYAKAWIDHGVAPSEASYEYLVVPDATISGMEALMMDLESSSPPFVVRQKDPAVHVVEMGEVTGYVVFEGGASIDHGAVVGASGSALMASRVVDRYQQLSFSKPELDLEFRVEAEPGEMITEVTLDGVWEVDDPDVRVELLAHDAGSTQLQFTTRHGLPVEVGLVQPLAFGEWQQASFEESQWADSGIVGPEADPDGDGVPNAIEYACGLDPLVHQAMHEVFQFVRTVDGFSATFRTDRARSDFDLRLEESGDLETWSELEADPSGVEMGIELHQAELAFDVSRRFLRLRAMPRQAP